MEDQSLYLEIKEEIQSQQELLKTFTEEEDDVNEDEQAYGENKEQQQIVEKINEKKKELESVCNRIKRDTRDLVRSFEEGSP